MKRNKENKKYKEWAKKAKEYHPEFSDEQMIFQAS